MQEAAPALLVALEGSALGLAIRQSVWAYPIANVLHIVSLAVFAGAVSVMDMRLLGLMPATVPIEVVRPARRLAVLALLGLISTGSVLFIAEASHVSLNAVFQVKAALIGLGIFNALLLARRSGRDIAEWPAFTPLPGRVRIAACLSIVIWLAVAASGRMIAYF